ncbi:unnamed protein product [Acanthosepion pharaonis]|uniref:Uncharacterized protein n=1 Tax=Acanthosepion pharaonis TaxID=158019 RepID=A0A812EJP5_ACAPH|nr:unnamed protein product [Sepia pharaonis]
MSYEIASYSLCPTKLFSPFLCPTKVFFLSPCPSILFPFTLTHQVVSLLSFSLLPVPPSWVFFILPVQQNCFPSRCPIELFSLLPIPRSFFPFSLSHQIFFPSFNVPPSFYLLCSTKFSFLLPEHVSSFRFFLTHHFFLSLSKYHSPPISLSLSLSNSLSSHSLSLQKFFR